MSNKSPAFITLPLLVAPPSPIGWHQVSAPGGYETWRFEAEDAAGEYRLLAELVQGCCYHRRYYTAYRAYRHRPTRIAPPVPSDWPCIHLWLYRRGELAASFVSEHAAGEFSASVNNGDVAIGSSRATHRADGSIELALRRGPSTQNGSGIATTLEFVPQGKLPVVQSPLFPRALRPLASPTRWGGEHWWLATAPRCQVRGSIQLHEAHAPDAPQVIQFTGRGYCDRTFGTAPPGRGLKRMMRGRLLLEDRSLVFQLAMAARSHRTVAHLLEADATAATMRPASVSVRWDGRTPMQMRYPTHIAFEEAGVQLVNPTLLAVQPYGMHLQYELAGRNAETAFCEIVYPRRLRWPGVNQLLVR